MEGQNSTTQVKGAKVPKKWQKLALPNDLTDPWRLMLTSNVAESNPSIMELKGDAGEGWMDHRTDSVMHSCVPNVVQTKTYGRYF